MILTRLLSATALLAVAIAATTQVSAQRAPVVVVASDAVQAALVELRPRLEREAGAPVIFRFGTSPILQRGILAGDTFDVAVLPPAIVGSLGTAGKIVPSTATDLGRVGIGIGVRAGAARPDIRTTDALKRTLLAATAITYVKDGASRANVEQAIERLGITQQLAARTLLLSGFEEMGRAIAAGRATLVFAPLSEIPLMAGVDVLGPLPGELQSYVSFQAAVSSGSKDSSAAQAVARLLGSSDGAAVLRSKGLEVSR